MKKTDCPDLARLPQQNPCKHFLNWLWKRPRWFVEDLYDKYYVFPNLEKQKQEIMKKNLEIETLKLKIQLYEVEQKPYSKFPKIVKS